jgi:outer membrane assembly lipoprotein YfiO
LLAALCLAGCETTFGGGKKAAAPATWSPDSGWQVAEKAESSPTAAALRAEAQKAFDAGAYQDALTGLLAMQKNFPKAAEAEDGQTHFLIAESYLNLGDYEKAHEHYRKVLKPGSGDDLTNRALSRIYHIGLFFVQGKAKRRFAGIQYNSASYGVEILTGEKGLITLYPSLEYADDALLEIARYYFDRKQYPEAQSVYERLVRDYSDREWAELAEFQLAVTVYKQVRGVDYDQGPLKKAKRLFNLYRVHHPRGVHIEKVRANLDAIAEMEAQHDLKVAKYYLRESQPEAAMKYLREVLLNNPKTDAARQAREMYRQMAEYRGLQDADADAGEKRKDST